jgi:hypothetical protein
VRLEPYSPPTLGLGREVTDLSGANLPHSGPKRVMQAVARLARAWIVQVGWFRPLVTNLLPSVRVVSVKTTCGERGFARAPLACGQACACRVKTLGGEGAALKPERALLHREAKDCNSAYRAGGEKR